MEREVQNFNIKHRKRGVFKKKRKEKDNREFGPKPIDLPLYKSGWDIPNAVTVTWSPCPNLPQPGATWMPSI